MPRYKIYATETHGVSIEVEAETEEAAIDLALDSSEWNHEWSEIDDSGTWDIIEKEEKAE